MPRRRITRLTNRALKSGDLTDAFRHTGFAVATAAAAGHGGSMRADTGGAGPLPATSSSAPSSASVGAPSSAAAAPDPATPPSLQLPLPPPIYVNPLARVANLRPERIDEGVDYAG